MTTINCKTRTEDQIRIKTITWIIPQFLSLLRNMSTRVLKCTISNDQNKYMIDAPKFKIKMEFFGSNNDIFEIYYLSSNTAYLKSALKINSRNSCGPFIGDEHYCTIQANKWQCLATFKKEHIFSNVANYLLCDGSLHLEVQFMVSNYDSFHGFEAQLSNDFKNLLNDEMFSDVIVKSVDGNEFKGHKAVLASRSAVLKAHFVHKTTEFHTNVVETSLDSEILREVLTFIYSDKAPRIDEFPEELLAAADFYQLSRLKRFCEEALHKKLTIENAIETLQLADLHSAKILKQLTLEFIKDGQAKLITKTESWSKVSVELIKVIYEYMADDVEAGFK